MSYESQSGKLSLSKNYFMFKVMDTLFFNLADFWTIHETLIKIWYALHESWNLIILCNLIRFTFFFFFFVMVGNKYWLFWNNLVPCPWNTSILQLISRLRKIKVCKWQEWKMQTEQAFKRGNLYLKGSYYMQTITFHYHHQCLQCKLS